MGLPALLKVKSDNQLFIAKNLEKIGAVKIWKEEGELKKLVQKMDEKDNWVKVVDASLKICDGKGSNRVADAILE